MHNINDQYAWHACASAAAQSSCAEWPQRAKCGHAQKQNKYIDKIHTYIT